MDGDFREWERRKTCLKVGKGRLISGLVYGLVQEDYFVLWAEVNESYQSQEVF